MTPLNTIAKRGSDRKDLEDMRKLTLNVAGLPVDVKLIYEKRQAQAQITKSDIKKFQNILTIKPGDRTNTQQELNFIRWPRNQLNFLIHKDGTIFRNLQEHINHLFNVLEVRYSLQACHRLAFLCLPIDELTPQQAWFLIGRIHASFFFCRLLRGPTFVFLLAFLRLFILNLFKV